MFKRFVNVVESVVAALAVVTVVLLFVAKPTVAVEASPNLAAGAEIYAAKCAGCHGSSRGGGVGPVLTGDGALARFGASVDVAKFVSVGSPGNMPGFETRLTPDEINAVAEFVFDGRS